MPRTAIPRHLIHNPYEVKQNAERFDDLCRLAEEVAFPIISEALVRETIAAGAQALTDEAKSALETLVEDAAIFETLDERRVLYEVKKSLTGTIPPPEEEECRRHSRELSQILISTWLESLRAQAKEDALVLSEFLLLETPSSWITRIWEFIGSRKPELSESLTDAFALFALNKDEAATIMSTLRLKLFPEPSLVDLPFDLILLGAPEMDVMAMPREYYQRLSDEIERQLETMEAARRIAAEKRAREFVIAKSVTTRPSFASVLTQKAAESLSEPLPALQYGYLAQAASARVQTENIATRVHYALTKP